MPQSFQQRRELSEQEFSALADPIIAQAPQGLSEDEFNRWIGPRLEQAIGVVENTAPPPEGSAVGRFASGVGEMLNPVTIAKGLGHAIAHPIDTATGLVGAQVGEFRKAANAPSISEALGHGAAGLIPILGPMAAKIGEQVGGGDIAGGLGRATGLLAAPTVTKGAMKGAGAATRGLGNVITGRAVPLVRSALKSPLSDVRARARIEGLKPNDVADAQAQFIVDQQLRTEAQANALAKASGQAVDAETATVEAANPNLRVDTAERIPRYFNEFITEKIEPQMLPGRDRAAVQAVGREVVKDSPLSRPTYRQPPPETLEEGLIRGMREGVTAVENAGQRVTAPTAGHQFTTEGGAFPQSSRPRELRTDIKPSELLPIIRTKSFFDKDAPAGQIQGGKVLERAVRDSFKNAVPAAEAHLTRQGRAMDAERLLDRMAWRDANRDAAGLGAIMGIANKAPGIGLLLQLLKESQLTGGLMAGKYGPRIARTGAPIGASGEPLGRILQLLTAGSQPPPEE